MVVAPSWWWAGFSSGEQQGPFTAAGLVLLPIFHLSHCTSCCAEARAVHAGLLSGLVQATGILMLFLLSYVVTTTILLYAV